VRPVKSVDELARDGIFDSDEELEELVVVRTVVLDTDVSSLITKRQLPARLGALLTDRLFSITS